MKTNRQTVLKLLSLLLFVFACNIPGGQTPTPIVVTATIDLAATITAQAQLIQNGVQPVPETSTPEAQFTATITLTETPSIPIVTVSKNTNCRMGPGKDYENIDALVIGQTAEVIGKNTPTKYWIIKRPTGTGECWLWGEYATVSGDVSRLKEYAIPATPTPTIPEPVSDLSENKICFFDGFSYKLSGFIKWQDASNNEEGFKVFFNGNLHGSVPTGTTTYAIPQINVAPGGSISMAVQSFNSAGKSQARDITITCP